MLAGRAQCRPVQLDPEIHGVVVRLSGTLTAQEGRRVSFREVVARGLRELQKKVAGDTNDNPARS